MLPTLHLLTVFVSSIVAWSSFLLGSSLASKRTPSESNPFHNYPFHLVWLHQHQSESSLFAGALLRSQDRYSTSTRVSTFCCTKGKSWHYKTCETHVHQCPSCWPWKEQIGHGHPQHWLKIEAWACEYVSRFAYLTSIYVILYHFFSWGTPRA